jgi:hypothetical protein
MCLIFRMHLKSLNDKAAQREQAEGRPKGFRYLL